MRLPNDLRSFVSTLKLGGLLPCQPTEELGHKHSWKSHIYPMIMSILAWINFIRFITHVIWVPADSFKQMLFSGLLSCYMLSSALLRTLISLANFKNQGLVRSIQKLQDLNCPMWEELKPHVEECRRNRSKIINFIHFFSWFFVICSLCFYLAMGLLRQPSMRLMYAPFSYLDNDDAQYLGVFFVCLLSLANDTGAIFINTFILAYTIELASKFDFITKWIEGRGIQRPVISSEENQQTEPEIKPILEFDVENIRMAHLFWYIRVKEFDKIARLAITMSMSIGFLSLLINVYLIIWGNGEMTFSHAVWSCFGLFYLFLHLIGSSHLNKTAIDVTEAIFKVPTRMLFNQDNSMTNFNLLLFIGQCTSEPVALTFLDLFYLRNETVMAVSSILYLLTNIVFLSIFFFKLLGTLTTYFLILMDFQNQESKIVTIRNSTILTTMQP